MTIKQLKQAIADLPDHMDVFIGIRLTEFDYGAVNSAYVKKIDFYDSESDETPLASDDVFVLDEE